MAEDDIYKSKARYEYVTNNLERLTKRPKKGSRRKYYCKNKANLKYYKELMKYFELKDLSYIRRRKALYTMRVITYAIKKNLKDCERDDINQLVAYSHQVFKTVASKRDFIKDLKCIWRILFPETDMKGRIDETITPYVVRHISRKVDKSKEKLRNDRFTQKEFQSIVEFFADEPKMQAYLMLAFESLGRPQEILYTKVKDYQFFDNFAKVWISEHGKEGTGFLQCIDSYPYILQWFRNHPLKKNQDAFFFINESHNGQYKQMKNSNINKRLKFACKMLGISKNITCYSLKRNGITHRRLKGESDIEIQHAARWTSTRQLQIYDMSTQQDALNMALEKRGMDNQGETKMDINTKQCIFCGYDNGCTAEICVVCKRPLDREELKQRVKVHERLANQNIVQKLDKMEEFLMKREKQLKKRLVTSTVTKKTHPNKVSHALIQPTSSKF